MRKQHFTTQVASLVNPPLLSKYEKLQQEMFENIYASNKTPLGRTPFPTVPSEAIKQGFGIITKKDDSAGALLYPFNCRIFCSIYNDSFRPPCIAKCSDIPPAGVKKEGIDENGSQMKEIFEDTRSIEPTVIAPLKSFQLKYMKNNFIDEKRLNFDLIDSRNNIHCLAPSGQVKACVYMDNLLLALWNLVKNKKPCYRKHFYSYLKSYLQNFSKPFTIDDLQKMFENFDMTVSKHSVKQVLAAFGTLNNDEEINYDKFLKALKWESILNEPTKVQKSRNYCETKNVIPPYSISTERYKTTPSLMDDLSALKTAGLPSIRSDIKKPKLKNVADFHEYGDIKNLASIVQPGVFEKYGVYEDDLGALRSKEEIKSILTKSGISFNNEVFNVIWEKVKKKGKASIGEIWSELKYLCLTKNSLFPS